MRIKAYAYWWENTGTRKQWRKRRVQRTLRFKVLPTPKEVETELKKILGEETNLIGYFEI